MNDSMKIINPSGVACLTTAMAVIMEATVNPAALNPADNDATITLVQNWQMNSH